MILTRTLFIPNNTVKAERHAVGGGRRIYRKSRRNRRVGKKSVCRKRYSGGRRRVLALRKKRGGMPTTDKNNDCHLIYPYSCFLRSGRDIFISEDKSTVHRNGKLFFHLQPHLCLTNLEASAGYINTIAYGEFVVDWVSGVVVNKNSAVSDAFNACLGAVQMDGIVGRTMDLSRVETYKDTSYFLDLTDCSLHSKEMSKPQGEDCVKVGDRIGVHVKAGMNGFVKYFKNGQPFGASFSGNLPNYLRIAVQLTTPHVSIKLLRPPFQ